MPDPHPQLRILHTRIQERCDAIIAQHPDWPCRKGCDHCCRNLAHLPSCTAAEWDLIAAALVRLPQPARAQLMRRATEFAGQSSGPFTCPFLDTDAGACRIYDSRPVVCRTYGFYVDRDRGAYCSTITQRVDTGEFADVIWGNETSTDAQVSTLGPQISLADWLNR